MSNDLTFLAEQVSHHPPVSAFYAEHVNKKIMCSAHIYTKSKFLGLSIGVHHIGQGSIYLLEKGEEYVITFPSAYGRSILTVPWIELGGSVTVNCPQSGYHANIDFLTKVKTTKSAHYYYSFYFIIADEIIFISFIPQISLFMVVKNIESPVRY